MKGAGAPRVPAPRPTFSAAELARSLRLLAGPLTGSRLCVAFSGGLDSTALLAACAALQGRYRCQVRAVHVNHHLQPAARAMAVAARRTARSLGVRIKVVNAPVSLGRGESVEALARAARYSALHGQLRGGEWLVLAQHQDDQVESVLLQLLRGAGIAGLAAMPPRAGPVLRPLLNITRSQLLGYLQARAITWSEDPSNADERFGRNFLRRRVLPLLRERWPGLGAAVTRSAALAAEAQHLLGERAATLLASAYDGAALSVSVLRRLPELERRNALRHWLGQRGLSMPDQPRLREIAGPMLRARRDAQPIVRWSEGMVRRHGDLLYAESLQAERSKTSGAELLRWNWRRQPRLELPGGGWLELKRDPHGELQGSALPVQLIVAFRRADGTVSGRPAGRRLKRALQTGALPPWERSAVPLIYAGRRLVAVGDWWRAAECTAGEAARSARRCRLHWRRGDYLRQAL